MSLRKCDMFKVGDILEATCEEDEPYGITYKGCVVKVIGIDETPHREDDLRVKVLSHEDEYWANEIEKMGSFPVESRYFKLKRDILFEEVM